VLNFCRRKYPSVAESIRASCHGLSRVKQKLRKSAFSEGVRHFERQFQVDGDVARNRSMERWIGEWRSYNFAAGSFHTKKLCSRLLSREVEFYWHKQQYRVFVPPFGGLRGNVRGSSMACWKARGQLPISANWTLSIAIMVEALWADIGRNCAVWNGVGHFERKFQGERVVPHQRFLAPEN